MTLTLKITAIFVIFVIGCTLCFRLGEINCVASHLEDTSEKMAVMSYHKEKIDDKEPTDTNDPDPTNDTVDEDEEVNIENPKERGEDEGEINLHSSIEKPNQDTADLYFKEESTESIVISFWPR